MIAVFYISLQLRVCFSIVWMVVVIPKIISPLALIFSNAVKKKSLLKERSSPNSFPKKFELLRITGNTNFLSPLLFGRLNSSACSSSHHGFKLNSTKDKMNSSILHWFCQKDLQNESFYLASRQNDVQTALLESSAIIFPDQAVRGRKIKKIAIS